MSELRAGLEAALAASPDNLTLHAAYADHLIEAGDPRGEFIRLQLALEDHSLSRDRRQAIEFEVERLLNRHQHEWLGELAEYFYTDQQFEQHHVTWKRGWVHSLRFSCLPEDLITILRQAEQLQLLRALTIESQYQLFNWQTVWRPTTSVLQLADSPAVRNLRWLTLGVGISWTQTHLHGNLRPLLASMPQLESLQIAAWYCEDLEGIFSAPLPMLRTLVIYVRTRRCPLALIGENPHFASLETINIEYSFNETDLGEDVVISGEHEAVSLHDLRSFFRSPHLTSLRELSLCLPEVGDDCVEELIVSGMLPRLRGLELRQCGITDIGAEMLARCPEVPKLEYLYLDHNLISPAGIEALAAVGVPVSEQQRFSPSRDDLDWPPVP